MNKRDELQATIPGLSKIIAVTGNVDYIGFSKVSSLTFLEAAAAHQPSYTLLLVLESAQSVKNYRLRMRFTGVKVLTLQEFGGWPTQITGFSVTDVSDRQLEGIKFEVKDYEGGIIRFFCESAEVQDVEEINL
jgi:hypothetical protein